MIYEAVKAALDAHGVLPREAFHPLPTIEERDVWTHLDSEARAYYAGVAPLLVNFRVPFLSGTAYTDFKRTGNRRRFEDLYFERRRRLYQMCICECIENGGRFVDNIFDLVWAICDESTWVIPAHFRNDGNSEVKEPTLLDVTHELTYIDLFSAETGALLMWVVYLLGSRLDAITPVIVKRIKALVDERIIRVFLAHPEMHWTGLVEDRKLNNWTPWIYSNLLNAALLLEDDPVKRSRIVLLTAQGCDKFLECYTDDGGCDEGPSYFDRAGASLLDTLELIELATGADVYSQPKIRNIASYIRHVSIAGDYYLNFADAPVRVHPDTQLLSRMALRMDLPELKHFAEGLLYEKKARAPYESGVFGIFRQMRNLITYRKNVIKPEPAQRELSHVFNGIQVAIMRQKTDESGLYCAIKGGTNGECHNHNDVGNYVIYADGEPFVCDIGVETYRRETFNDMRYTIWAMQSRWHNTAIIGESDQLPGIEFAARDFSFTDNGSCARASMDIAGAWSEFAHVDSYLRTLTMHREAGVVILEDEYELSEEMPVTLPLILANEPRIAPGEIQISGEKSLLRIKYDAQSLTAAVEEAPLADAKLRGEWQRDKLYRLLLTAKSTQKGRIRLDFML